jgi:hypothetical protein
METNETTLSIQLDSLLTTNKAIRTDLAQSVVQDVRDGNIDAVQALIYACKAEEVFKSIIDNVRPIVAGKQIQKGGIKLYDAEIIEKKNPDKFDFSVCSDSEWNRLNALLEETKANLKVRETFLKTLSEPMATLDGEIINPPEKIYGAMNVSVKLT